MFNTVQTIPPTVNIMRISAQQANINVMKENFIKEKITDNNRWAASMLISGGNRIICLYIIPIYYALKSLYYDIL